MGLDYTVYVGPYVKCINPLVDVEEKYRACTNPVCKSFKKQTSESGFCKDCGQPIGTITRTKKKAKVSAWELREQINERLANVNTEYPWDELKRPDAEVDIWISNINGKGGDRFDPKSESKYFDLTNFDIGREMETFGIDFHKEIGQLVAAYGSENIEIRWGVFNWIY